MHEFLSLVVGALLPPLISWLKDCGWRKERKVAFSLAVSLLVGLLTTLATGELTTTDVAASAALVFTAATSVYRFWFHDTPVYRVLESKRVL